MAFISCYLLRVEMSSSSDETKPTLKTKSLGSSGLKVSELCLGTMTFNYDDANGWGLPTANRDDSHEMMNYFRDCGGNFIDTGTLVCVCVCVCVCEGIECGGVEGR